MLKRGTCPMKVKKNMEGKCEIETNNQANGDHAASTPSIEFDSFPSDHYEGRKCNQRNEHFIESIGNNRGKGKTRYSCQDDFKNKV